MWKWSSGGVCVHPPFVFSGRAGRDVSQKSDLPPPHPHPHPACPYSSLFTLLNLNLQADQLILNIIIYSRWSFIGRSVAEIFIYIYNFRHSHSSWRKITSSSSLPAPLHHIFTLNFLEIISFSSSCFSSSSCVQMGFLSSSSSSSFPSSACRSTPRSLGGLRPWRLAACEKPASLLVWQSDHLRGSFWPRWWKSAERQKRRKHQTTEDCSQWTAGRGNAPWRLTGRLLTEMIDWDD